MATPSSPVSPSSTEELSEFFNRLSARPQSWSPEHYDAKSSSKRFSLPIQHPREPQQRCPIRNAVAPILILKETSIDCKTTFLNDEDITSTQSLTNFSSADEKKYSFDFKLPIYKAYPISEWCQKVLDALEDSKDRFKPLAEQVATVRFKSPDVTSPTIRTTFPKSPAPQFSELSFRGRSPTPSVHSTGSSPTPSVHPKAGNIRTLKKRCIGRDKRVEVDTNAKSWFYDAEVSACESPTTTSFVTFPPAPPSSSADSDSSPMFAVENNPNAVNGHKRRIHESVLATKTGYTVPPLGQMSSNGRLVTGWHDGGCEAIAV